MAEFRPKLKLAHLLLLGRRLRASFSNTQLASVPLPNQKGRMIKTDRQTLRTEIDWTDCLMRTSGTLGYCSLLLSLAASALNAT
jgi:hypothetical protein